MNELHLTFDGIDQGKANQLASDLRDYLRRNADSEAAIVKEKENTQDFGATLVLVLGTGSAIALAKGIADWLRKKPETVVTIKTSKGEVVVQNVRSQDARSVLEESFKGLSANAD